MEIYIRQIDNWKIIGFIIGNRRQPIIAIDKNQSIDSVLKYLL